MLLALSPIVADDRLDTAHGRYEPWAGTDLEGRPLFIHRIVDDGVATVLDVADPTPLAVPGSVLRVHGRRDGRHLALDRFSVEAPPPSPAIDPAPLPPRTLALLLLDFGADPLPFTIDEARTRMFDAADSSAAYYAEASFGKESLTGDVFGTYTIPWPGSCDPDAIAASAIAAMAADGHDPTAYSQLMYLFPGGCDFGGLAQLGIPGQPARDSWYNGYFDCVVRNQEVGHNYGMVHSHSYECASGSAFESCPGNEYGNPYDPMGGGCAHISAHQKQYMGWLEGCNMVSSTADGRFQLLPLELPCDGIQALRLPAYDGRQYYLEYRQPLGFDGALSGVLVNVSGVADYYGPDAFVLTGIGDGGFLRAGDSYTDPQGLVTFTIVELLDTHAVIDVVFADGGAGEPTCEGGGTPEAVADVWGVLACAGGPFQGDAEPPVVAITSPTDGQRFDPGASFTIEVDASDDVMVSRVSLWLDGTLQSTLTAPPWQWPVQDAPVGTFELYAVADDGIHEAQSAIVTFEVRETDAPGADSEGGGEGGGTAGAGTDGDADPAGTSDGDPALPPGFGGADGDAAGCGCRGGGTGPGAAMPWIACVVGFALRRRRGTAEAVRRDPNRAA